MSKSTTSVLNDLIEVLKDGQEGFRAAAEAIDDTAHKSMLSDASLQRSRFSGELQQLVQGLGEEPEKTSSISSALHRGWINLRTSIQGGDAHAVFAECERGEDSAVANYKDALEAELPANVRSVVETQYVAVKATHDKVRTLRDALKAAQ